MPSSALPPVAVVLPLHNGGPWIRDTLQAVCTQTHPPAEIVVVNDGSTDDGPAQAAAMPNVTVIDCPRSSVQGAGPGRQCGFEATTAPFVAFLDQDDLWHPAHLRLLATALHDRLAVPAAVAAVCPFQDGETPTYGSPHLDPSTYDPWHDFPLTTIWSPSGALVRRSALRAAGGWPTTSPVTDQRAWFELSTDQPFVENRCVTWAKREHEASKSNALRTNQQTTFIQDHARFLAPLLSQRARRHPDEVPQLKTNLRAFYATGLLSAAYQTRSPAPLRNAAPALDALAATDPRILNRLLDHLFAYFLQPAYRGRASEQADLLELFVAAWPPGAPRAGAALQSFLVQGLSIRAFPIYVERAPLQRMRWRLGRAAAQHWFRQRRAHLRFW